MLEITPRPLLRALCLSVSLSIAGCGSDVGAPGVAVIVATGGPAPGLDAEYRFGGTADHYAMGADGHVVFSGQANVENGNARTRIEAIWFGRPGSIQPIARVADPLPGADDDAALSGFSPRPMIVTRGGAVGFVVQTTRRTVGASSEALLARHDDELRTVAATGDEVPAPNGAGRLMRINQFAMSEAGVLLMGTYARRETAIWFWDSSTLQLVAGDRGTLTLGDVQCQVGSLASTTLDMNAAGIAVFRVSLVGNACPRQAMVAWNARDASFTTVASSRAPIAPGADEFFQSLTADARIGDAGTVALHGNVYLNSASNRAAREMMLVQASPGAPSVALIDTQTTFEAEPDVELTHTIHGDGMAAVGERELVHFVRSNRDRILLRTTLGDEPAHTLIAHSGTTLDGQAAARIGNAQVNRRGDVVFTSFVDDGPVGGVYQQELWRAGHSNALTRIAFAGRPIDGRDGETIESIDTGSQSHEPTTEGTEGGRSRRISDAGEVMFSGRLRKGTQSHRALFVARFE
ncbi:MAG: hypothetical protein V2J24_14675 [Pseudomonadales bacterium]|jgi:hypothetical protein|nr:hypothetical protein [Pseudomonadales bacterium]